jgi:hypothetical protein
VKKPNNFFLFLLISTISVSLIPFASGAPQLETEYSLNYLNAPQSIKDHVRYIFSTESNAWSYASAINPYRKNKNFDALLPPCNEIKIQVCISSVETRNGGEAWKTAEVLPDAGHRINEIPTFNDSGLPVSYKYSTFDGDLGNFLPPGGNPRLWKSNQEVLDGALISVVADVHGAQVQNSSGLALQVKLVTNKQEPQGCLAVRGAWINNEGGKANNGFCDLTLKIPANIEFRVKIKFTDFEDPIKGWFTSTVLNPNIEYTGNTLTISGGATSHPNFVSDPIPFSDWCEVYVKKFTQYPCPYDGKFPRPQGSQSFTNREWSSGAMPYKKYFRNESLGENNLWLFESTSSTPFNTTFSNEIPNCKLSKPIFGVISTDAALYNISDLKWNAGERNFEYSIYSPHANSSGAVISGFFSLLVDRAVANCLWNTDLTTAKAVLSVSYEDGTSEIMTTSIGKNDSWISFSAAGFHYSEPRFVARLELPAKDSEAVVPPKLNSKKTSVTIFCAKGLTVKKVSGNKPKCPSGYKLKK